MPAAKQTITIVNQSGKVVSTSKHLVNVFKEARTAYGERKAELKAQRRLEADDKEKERKLHRQLEALALADHDDATSRASSRRTSRRGSEDGKHFKRKPVPDRQSSRPTASRGVTDSYIANDRPSSYTARRSSDDGDSRHGELTRRHTDGLLRQSPPSSPRHRRPKTRRSASVDDIDMDLAYGELPPPLPERKRNVELELRSKIVSLETLLDEFNCLQHSVTHIIEHLQSNPQALAAVALTLGEISNLAAKLGPAALASLKTAYPAAIALLASPQFAIAAGVGVGVTIIAFGGYKIVKKIQASKEAKGRLLEFEGRNGGAAVGDGGGEMDELREIDRIESWRRGLAEIDAASAGTSVEGELLTPHATRTLIEDGRLTEADLKKVDASSAGPSKRKKTKSASGSSKSGKSGKSSKVKVKSKKEPSGLRMLFKKHASSSEKKTVVEA